MSAGYYVNRDAEKDAQEGVDAFDRAYFARYGRYPDDSPQAARTSDPRRARIEALVTAGATEGERAAAQAALHRFDATHAEQDAMQRAGNHTGETL